jgi:hypothetical protein
MTIATTSSTARQSVLKHVPELALGTDGSNPSPSSAESAANLTPWIRVPNWS